VNNELDYTAARYREAGEVARQAETAARRARQVRQSAETLMAHHLSVLVEQNGQWATNPEQGTTLACAQWAVSQWNKARAVEAVACGTADLAHARFADLSRDVLAASRAR
jgi:hypothetical protein